VIVIVLFLVLVGGIVWYCRKHNDSFQGLFGGDRTVNEYALVEGGGSSKYISLVDVNDQISELEADMSDEDLDLSV